MSDLAMDMVTNDLLIVNGDLSVVTGDAAIRQDLQQTLQVWLGEWFLDTTKGLPFKQQILVKNPVIDLVQADFFVAAQNVPGVTEITGISLDYSKSNRSLSVTMTAKTTTGQTITASASIGLPTNQTIQGTVF